MQNTLNIFLSGRSRNVILVDDSDIYKIHIATLNRKYIYSAWKRSVGLTPRLKPNSQHKLKIFLKLEKTQIFFSFV